MERSSARQLEQRLHDREDADRVLSALEVDALDHGRRVGVLENVIGFVYVDVLAHTGHLGHSRDHGVERGIEHHLEQVLVALEAAQLENRELLLGVKAVGPFEKLTADGRVDESVQPWD